MKPGTPAVDHLASLAADIHFRLRAQGLRARRGLANLAACSGKLMRIAGHAELKAGWAPAADGANPADPDRLWRHIAGAAATPLWTGADGAGAAAPGAEWRLTAGKIHNLRVAARRLDGLMIPAGARFSFWRNLGRPTRARGYVAGRELREGCLISSVGGGLCQLSNALYQAALAAGCEITERHRHSKVIAGSAAAQGRDATVFWNYVDLCFVAPRALLLEVSLTAGELLVNLRENAAPAGAGCVVPLAPRGAAAPARPDDAPHDCVACSNTDCTHFIPNTAGQGRTLWLLDDHWPEFDQWRQERQRPRDLVFATIDGARYGWRRYVWGELAGHPLTQLPWIALSRAIAARRYKTPSTRRAAELIADAALARAVAARIPLDVDHIVAPLSLLAQLSEAGVLGGRRVTAWINRPPLQWLHRQLDEAALSHPQTGSLTDFRAPAALLAAERAALARVTLAVTPHREIARYLRGEAGIAVEAIGWHGAPAALDRITAAAAGEPPAILFPGPALARKGAYAVREAARALGLRIKVPGGASESADFWAGVERVPASGADCLEGVRCVVLPAWIEPQPRLLLAALGRGIPVLASAACGLEGMPGVRIVAPGDGAALRLALAEVLWPAADAAVRAAA